VLRRNLANVPGAIVIEAAIWNAATRVRIVDETVEAWAFRVEECNQASSGIATVTIARALERVADGVLFIVKVDIEGAESNLFADNVGWLDELPLLIIELHDWLLPWRGTSRNFLRAMMRFDNDLVQKGENQFWFRAS
jgi:hypothetical protein